MKDFGINKGLVQDFNTSERRTKGSMYGFRKMFWHYLNKLNVPFYDECCTEAGSGIDFLPIRYNNILGIQEKFNGTIWTSIAGTMVPTVSTAKNVTGVVTAAEIVGGQITSTSVTPVSLTLPTTAALAVLVGSVSGTTLVFSVVNTGPSTVTLVLGTGMLASSALTGGTNLVITAGSIGQFRIYLSSGTVSNISRIS